MTTFVNQRADSALRSVEFSTAGGLNYSFIQLAPGADAAATSAWLTSRGMAQEIISQTNHGDHTLIVARGKLTPDTLKQKFAAHGEPLVPAAPDPKPFQPWKWRGVASVIGQSLQFYSGLKKSESATERASYVGFASANMLANVSNWIFGAQEKEDPHHLQALKTELNAKFAPEIMAGKSLAAPTTTLVTRRNKEQPHYTIGEQLYNFAQRYSVSFGEIFLRVLGTFALIFPVGNIAPALKDLQNTKSIGKAFARSQQGHNPTTMKIGAFWMLGKAVALMSKEPDPYNPKPQTALDRIRENYTFKLSSVMEGTASGMMAYSKYNKKDKLTGTRKPDMPGTIGGSVFVGGFGIRYFAPFGTREVNMKELGAHITDSLSKMPEERIPAVLAETVVQLKQHFTDKNLKISNLYSQIASDLETYHHIHLKPIASGPAAPAASSHEPAEKPTPLHAVSPVHATHHGRIDADKQAALSA